MWLDKGIKMKFVIWCRYNDTFIPKWWLFLKTPTQIEMEVIFHFLSFFFFLFLTLKMFWCMWQRDSYFFSKFRNQSSKGKFTWLKSISLLKLLLNEKVVSFAFQIKVLEHCLGVPYFIRPGRQLHIILCAFIFPLVSPVLIEIKSC